MLDERWGGRSGHQPRTTSSLIDGKWADRCRRVAVVVSPGRCCREALSVFDEIGFGVWDRKRTVLT